MGEMDRDMGVQGRVAHIVVMLKVLKAQPVL